MEQKNQPQQPKQQAGQNQSGQQQGNQPGKQGQPGSNPARNEEFPGKAPEIYSDKNREPKNRDRSETPDAARNQGSPSEPSRRQ